LPKEAIMPDNGGICYLRLGGFFEFVASASKAQIAEFGRDTARRS
jgi:hypothetical protein